MAESVRQLVETLRQTPPTGPRNALCSRFARSEPSIPPEHIAEARRECWATMPPDLGGV